MKPIELSFPQIDPEPNHRHTFRVYLMVSVPPDRHSQIYTESRDFPSRNRNLFLCDYRFLVFHMHAKTKRILESKKMYSLWAELNIRKALSIHGIN